MLCSLFSVLLLPLCLTNYYGFAMEKNINNVEEIDALKASFPQLLSQLDKVSYAVTQIRDKQQVLDAPMKEQLELLVKSLHTSCATLALLNFSLYDHE